jgi:hypothetical protein
MKFSVVHSITRETPLLLDQKIILARFGWISKSFSNKKNNDNYKLKLFNVLNKF